MSNDPEIIGMQLSLPASEGHSGTDQMESGTHGTRLAPVPTEKWEHWHPKGCKYLGESVATLCYVDLKEGILSVEIELAYQILHLQFFKTLAYRVHLEECVPDVWMKLHSPLPSQWTFWEILNSCWVAELKTTGGLALYPRARHFAVVTEQNLVEVLTQDEPMCPLRVTAKT